MLMLSILHRTKRQALFYEMNVNSCISAKYWVVPFLPDSNKKLCRSYLLYEKFCNFTFGEHSRDRLWFFVTGYYKNTTVSA